MKKRNQSKPNANAMNQDELRRVLKHDRKDSEESPKDAFDMVNEYGTYEIQQNTFPAIAQGLPKDWNFDEAKEKENR